MRKFNKKNAVMAVALVAVIAIGGAFAYLTDTDNQTNTFIFGSADGVQIDLSEPLWDALPDADGNGTPDAATDLWAGKVLPKDPTIENVGDNDVFTYIRVTVPYAENVITAQADGTRNAAADTELFTYAINGTKWTLLPGSEETDDTAKTITRVYYYNTALAAGATTEPLFSTVTFANIIEGQGVATNLAIPVIGYAIQSNFGDGATAKTPVEAWTLYANQNA